MNMPAPRAALTIFPFRRADLFLFTSAFQREGVRGRAPGVGSVAIRAWQNSR